MKDCTGTTVKFPLFDPYVSKAYHDPAALVSTLEAQIDSGMYARFFEGKRDLVFLDIGANIGLVSVYAAPACKRIVAVEPAEATFQALKGMAAAFPVIEPVRAALAPVDGEVVFFSNNLNSTASSTVNTFGVKSVVSGFTLRSILNIYQLEHVDVLKCDSEGAEGLSLSFDQLESASKIVDRFFIETHNCPASTWETKLGKLVEHLSRLGYHKQQIDGMAICAEK